ncbi:hypothetical protein BGZ96_011300, partial [Linnemannia gamsii]
EYGGGPALRWPAHADESFVFEQRFNDGRRRVLRIETNVREHEGMDTMVAYEQWFDN